MLERTKRYRERYKERGKRNSGKQKRKKGDFLEKMSIYVRFCYPLRINNLILS